MKAWVLGLILLALGAGAAEGQYKGGVEVGGFVQWSGSDEQTGLDGATGLGASLGYFLLERLSIEGAAGYSPTADSSPNTGDGSWVPLRGRLLWNFAPLERVRPFVGLGVVHNRYSGVADGSDTGASAIGGLRLHLNDEWAIRSDVSIDRVWSPFNEGQPFEGDAIDTHTNWMLTTGVSYTFGGTPRDGDGDGVPDREDECLMTPMGVQVDGVGCRVDSDGDGVFEEADRCAATPTGVEVDEFGCRVDADGDGVFDEDDQCAATPSGAAVDAAGCRMDTDGDGVFDEDDQCAATPSDVAVDGTGCRVDSDGDGVFDESDECRATPMGEEVGANGCAFVVAAGVASLVLEGVTFEPSSADLTPEAFEALDRVAVGLTERPDVRVRVVGHTDSTGSRDGNLRLSQARAESVVAYLTSQGIGSSRLEAEGRGPDEPIADNETTDGRRQNRRVELERIGG